MKAISNRKKLFNFSIYLMLAQFCSFAAPAKDLKDLIANFQSEMDQILSENNTPGMTAAFILSDGKIEIFASGKSDIAAGTAMKPSAVMPSGSIGKSFVAAIILQLAAENKLELDDRVKMWFINDEWFPRLPNSEFITVRSLLNHSTGWDDWLNNEMMFMGFYSTVGTDSAFPYTHEERVGALAETKPKFAVGKGYAYSDSNYHLLGLLIERITGKTYYQVIKQRILEPLALKSTFPADRRNFPNLAVGYLEKDNRFRLPERMVENGKLIYDPEMEWTAGGLITNPGDLVRWAQTFYGGNLIAFDYIEQMRSSGNGDMEKDGYLYSLGVQLMKMSGRDIFGHGGWIFGYTAGVYYFPGENIAVALQLNSIDRGYTEYAERLANVVLKYLE